MYSQKYIYSNTDMLTHIVCGGQIHPHLHTCMSVCVCGGGGARMHAIVYAHVLMCLRVCDEKHEPVGLCKHPRLFQDGAPSNNLLLCACTNTHTHTHTHTYTHTHTHTHRVIFNLFLTLGSRTVAIQNSLLLFFVWFFWLLFFNVLRNIRLISVLNKIFLGFFLP